VPISRPMMYCWFLAISPTLSRNGPTKTFKTNIG
jgi:hypothetical protein